MMQGSSLSSSGGGLIKDVTPAEKRQALGVAEFELEKLPEKRAVYVQRGALLFRSSRTDALRSLRARKSNASKEAEASREDLNVLE
mmetsp:Transcript_72293/g.200539  ORF Transcript_72293/g.200539 Transcript_72293/m.200539 type:complete len:86 (-) Transcript_72293:94-351(-)